MKLRLTEPGFEAYTAQLGVIFFQDGLSTDHVSVLDATRLGASMRCEWENGAPTNVSQIYLDNMNTPAPMPGQVVVLAGAEATPEVTKTVWTVTALSEIADKDGIAGLRVIADPMGLKGNSISGLMEQIVSAQLVK